VTDEEVKDVLSGMFKNTKKSKSGQLVGTLTRSRRDIVLTTSKSKKAFAGLSGKYWKEVEPVVIDNIHFKASIPIPDMEWLKKNINDKDIQDIYDGSIKYINSHSKLNKLAEKLAINAKVDNFFVGSVGTEDQKGTKIDIKLELQESGGSKEKIATQISLKTSGGDQFDQVAGISFDKQMKMWETNFKLEIKDLKKEWDNVMIPFYENVPVGGYSSRLDVRIKPQMNILKTAVRSVYSKAVVLMNKEFEMDKNRKVGNKYIEKLINYIAIGATGDERDYVELVKLTKATKKLKGSYKRVIFDKEYEERISSLKLNATIDMTKDPRVVITDITSGKQLIQIRFYSQRPSKKSSKGIKTYSVYGRNIVEARPDSILYTLMS
jgi:hypothetical protein